MKHKIIPSLLIFLLTGCGVVKKKTSYAENRKITVEAKKETANEGEEIVDILPVDSQDKAEKIIHTALQFSGVRYKYGGTTDKGMDCSGLLYVAFGTHNILLPRISYRMADEGKRIRVGDVTKGDLLFFKTSRKGKKINHVGLVVAVDKNEIKFIHSTTSRGVIVSSLREGFWNYAFVKATRIL